MSNTHTQKLLRCAKCLALLAGVEAVLCCRQQLAIVWLFMIKLPCCRCVVGHVDKEMTVSHRCPRKFSMLHCTQSHTGLLLGTWSCWLIRSLHSAPKESHSCKRSSVGDNTGVLEVKAARRTQSGLHHCTKEESVFSLAMEGGVVVEVKEALQSISEAAASASGCQLLLTSASFN